MNIAELFQGLSYGELSNLAMSEEGSGCIRPKDQPRVLAAADEALLLLHSKFVLTTKDLWIQCRKHISYYHLDGRFAESNTASLEDNLYIKDLLGDPFENDVIKVISVFDSNECRLPLNDAEQPLSVFTPQAKMIQVVNPVEGNLLNVLYQAKHLPLNLATLTQEIFLPEVLYSALRGYIADRMHSSIGTPEASAKAMEHLGNYDAMCQTMVDHDLVNTSSSTTNIRFQRNGWI